MEYLLIFGFVSTVYIYSIKPAYKRLTQLNYENDRLSEINQDLQNTLNEFSRQNQEYLSSNNICTNDPVYTPTDNTPDHYICPITKQIIRMPITIMDGTRQRSYERKALELWYNTGNRTTPLSRSHLEDPRYLENDLGLRKEITSYINSLRTSLQSESQEARTSLSTTELEETKSSQLFLNIVSAAVLVGGLHHLTSRSR